MSTWETKIRDIDTDAHAHRDWNTGYAAAAAAAEPQTTDPGLPFCDEDTRYRCTQCGWEGTDDHKDRRPHTDPEFAAYVTVWCCPRCLNDDFYVLDSPEGESN